MPYNIEIRKQNPYQNNKKQKEKVMIKTENNKKENEMEHKKIKLHNHKKRLCYNRKCPTIA